jgi:hypothetical protein
MCGQVTENLSLIPVIGPPLSSNVLVTDTCPGTLESRHNDSVDSFTNNSDSILTCRKEKRGSQFVQLVTSDEKAILSNRVVVKSEFLTYAGYPFSPSSHFLSTPRTYPNRAEGPRARLVCIYL